MRMGDVGDNKERQAAGEGRAAATGGGDRPADSMGMRLLNEERDAIRARREAFGFAPGDDRTVGLALSGGGIRSATFSLGVLQALSKTSLLPRIDYLSTVSGGSYIGSFFGALYVDRSNPKLGAQEQKAFAENPFGGPRGQKAIANLREFGRYLTPGGFSDTLFGASLILRNWVTLQLVLGLVPLLFFLGERVLRGLNLSRLLSGNALVQWQAAREGGFSWLLVTLTLVAAAFACGFAIAYWFSRRSNVPAHPLRRLIPNGPFIATAIAGVAIWMVLAASFAPQMARWTRLSQDTANRIGSVASDLSPAVLIFVQTAIVVAITGYLIIAFADWNRHKGKGDPATAGTEAEERVRGKLTRALATSNFALLILLAFTVVQFLGHELAGAAMAVSENWNEVQARLGQSQVWAALRVAFRNFWPVMAILAPAALTIWGHVALRRGSGTGWLSRPLGQTMLGMSILFLWLIVWSAMAEAVPERWLGSFAVALLVITAVVGVSYGFLNLSSLATLYSARLKRAYIGASNTDAGSAGYDVDRSGDHIPMSLYHRQSGLQQYRPVHLINVTLAQTEPEGDSHVVAYDRKGKPLQASIGGVLYQGTRVGTLRGIPYSDAAEELPLSYWTSISGAAASTALGSLTSIGLSVLAMMANVRLGYWWQVSKGSLWPLVPHYLFKELTASFSADDKSPRWYLTDGGHFENTGAYALLQREVDFIVVCDNGADPDYRLDDMFRLIDRARIDLGARVSFLGSDELDKRFGPGREWEADTKHIRHAFGTYDELARRPDPGAYDPKAPPAPYAALAKVQWERTGKEGLLLLIKPRVNFTEPPELLAYRQREAGRDFPQQATLDQFFDEEQWEAYRRFGQVVGDRIFGESTGWAPARLIREIVPEPPGRGKQALATGGEDADA